jgi:glycosyltransferase involved in cell wall biosynthesis
MIRVAHVINGLGTGGAELMLARLLPLLQRADMPGMVVSLKPGGEVATRIREQGIDVTTLDFSPACAPSAARSLVRELRKFDPDVVQTWMYHADLLGGVAGRLLLRCPVVWNLRTTAPTELVGRQGLIRLCARLSRSVPRRIVCCSHAAAAAHAAFGYDSKRMVVIHNGFDLDQLRPDPDGALALRQELGLVPEVPLIGLVARFDPLKDHESFLAAAGLLARQRADVRFVLCGDSVTSDNRVLVEWAERAGIRDRCYFLGRRTDIRRVNSMLDIATCSSRMEGMPNVIGEAMACGVSCVVTDTGDASLLVGGTGTVVPPSNPERLAAAWRDALSLGRDRLREAGARARERIASEFSLERSVRRYTELYGAVASEPRNGRHSAVVGGAAASRR